MNAKKSVGLESTMLAVYTLSSKKRNVVVDPNKSDYNLQSMSRDISKSKLLLGKLRILLHGEIGVGEVAVLLHGEIVVGEVAVGEIID